ncbi:MAG: hypothetical protein R3B96_12720 [Pirellulaceae bacterium]
MMSPCCSIAKPIRSARPGRGPCDGSARNGRRPADAARATWTRLAILERYSLNGYTQFMHVRAVAGLGSDALRDLLDKSESLASESDPGRVVRLRVLALLELGEVDAALSEAQAFPDPLEQQGWEASILVIDGRWRAYRESLLGADAAVDRLDPNLDVTRLQLAAWAAGAGDESEWYEALNGRLHQSLGNQNWVQRVMFESLVGDVDRAVEIAAEHDRSIAAFLRSGQDRYAEALAESGIGTTPEARKAWYEQFLGELQQSEGKEPVGDPPMDPNVKLKLAIEAAGWLVAVGLEEEGGEYLDRLLHSIPDGFSTRRSFEQRILSLEFTNGMDEAFVEHASHVYGRPQFFQAFNEIRVSTAYETSHYTIWWQVLEGEQRDPLTRFKLIRNLLGDDHSQPVEPADLDRLVTAGTEYFANARGNNRGVADWRQALAHACFAYEDFTRGEQLLLDGVQQDNNNRAGQMLLDYYRETEQWEAVLDLAGRIATINQTAQGSNRLYIVDPRPSRKRSAARAGTNERGQ